MLELPLTLRDGMRTQNIPTSMLFELLQVTLIQNADSSLQLRAIRI